LELQLTHYRSASKKPAPVVFKKSGKGNECPRLVYHLRELGRKFDFSDIYREKSNEAGRYEQINGVEEGPPSNDKLVDHLQRNERSPKSAKNQNPHQGLPIFFQNLQNSNTSILGCLSV
jgi:hypothetical protein